MQIIIIQSKFKSNFNRNVTKHRSEFVIKEFKYKLNIDRYEIKYTVNMKKEMKCINVVQIII